jgi:hypothetical protein
MKIIYEARINTSCDGRGPDKVIGYFEMEDSAQRIVKGKDAYGGDGRVRPVEFYESINDYENNNPQTIKKRALAKLNDAEKKALGLL